MNLADTMRALTEGKKVHTPNSDYYFKLSPNNEKLVAVHKTGQHESIESYLNVGVEYLIYIPRIEFSKIDVNTRFNTAGSSTVYIRTRDINIGGTVYRCVNESNLKLYTILDNTMVERIS